MPDTYTGQLDPVHSSVEFSVKHMMMTTVRGRFKKVSATVTVNEGRPERSSVYVEIDTASVDTGAPDRDAHLRSPDFFDAERFPKITFRSKRIEGVPRSEGDHFRISGDLTIRDTTMQTVLDVEFEGRGTDPWGNERAGFSATTEIDRRDWGLRWNQAIETGGILVANKVRIEAEVQVVRQAEMAAV
jgi:polyisoprenoid-binding protein YceI